jgi:hypothetical protein
MAVLLAGLAVLLALLLTLLFSLLLALLPALVFGLLLVAGILGLLRMPLVGGLSCGSLWGWRGGFWERLFVWSLNVCRLFGGWFGSWRGSRLFETRLLSGNRLRSLPGDDWRWFSRLGSFHWRLLRRSDRLACQRLWRGLFGDWLW